MSEIYVPLPEVTMAEGLGGKEKDFYVIKHVLCFCVKRTLLVMQTMNEVNKSQIFPHGRLLASVVLCALVLIVSGCGGGAASSSDCTRMVTVSVPSGVFRKSHCRRQRCGEHAHGCKFRSGDVSAWNGAYAECEPLGSSDGDRSHTF